MKRVETTLKDRASRRNFSRQGKGGLISVIEGPDVGMSFKLNDAPLTIGTGDQAELRLADPRVSRRHLRVFPKGATLELRDLDSTNGSYVREIRFADVTIHYGTEFRIGNTVCKFVPIQEVMEVKASDIDHYGSLLGKSPQMRKLFQVLDQIAGEDITVLIGGETGTGKELVAREIHEHSPRKSKPFVVLDCASMPAELIESAIFGHVRGSFTGATADRKGAFESADEGTLFLDEIGELPLDLQPSLLRVLESRTVTPVGSNESKKVDVRIVAATNRQLEDEVEKGNFREDLYYRLAVVTVAVPSLNERLDDLPLLTDAFVRQFSRNKTVTIDSTTLERFAKHDWPGNVRELRNAVERLCLFGNKAEILQTKSLRKAPPPPEDEPKITSSDYRDAKRQAMDDFEKTFIENLMRKHNNNITSAASEARIDRKVIRELAKRYGIIS